MAVFAVDPMTPDSALRRAGVFAAMLCASATAWSADPSISDSMLSPSGETASVQGWQVLTIFGYLGLLSLMAFVGVRWWKGRVGAVATLARTKQIVVVETRRVTPAVTLVIAEVKGAPYLIASSGTGIAIQPLPGGPA